MKPKKYSNSDRLKFLCSITGLPIPVTEFRFAPPRRWLFDCAWPDRKIAAEIDGGVWAYQRGQKGRHSTGTGIMSDCEKFNTGTNAGWRIFRFVPDMLEDGTALMVLREAFDRL